MFLCYTHETYNINEIDKLIKKQTLSPNIFQQHLIKIRIHKNYLFDSNNDCYILDIWNNITEKEKIKNFLKFKEY